MMKMNKLQITGAFLSDLSEIFMGGGLGVRMCKQTCQRDGGVWGGCVHMTSAWLGMAWSDSDWLAESLSHGHSDIPNPQHSSLFTLPFYSFVSSFIKLTFPPWPLLLLVLIICLGKMNEIHPWCAWCSHLQRFLWICLTRTEHVRAIEKCSPLCWTHNNVGPEDVSVKPLTEMKFSFLQEFCRPPCVMKIRPTILTPKRTSLKYSVSMATALL